MGEFKRFLEVRQKLWYHGSRRPWTEIGEGKRKQSFGGIHMGSRQAALDRLENTPSQRVQGRPGPAWIYAVQANLHHPYNSQENPVSEHDLFIWLNAPDEEWIAIRQNHDGLYYKNNIEDPGSISLLVFDKSALQLMGQEEVTA